MSELLESFERADPRNRLERVGQAIEKLPESEIRDYARKRWQDAASLYADRMDALTFERFDRALEDARRAAREAVFEPLLIRDRDRQAGTHKPRGSRRPKLDAWLDRKLELRPDASNTELWGRLESENTDLDDVWIEDGMVCEFNDDRELTPIKRSGFDKRVTAARKRR